MYIKADILIKLNGQGLLFRRVNISKFGASSIPWNPKTTGQNFGKEVPIEIRIESLKVTFVGTASIFIQRTKGTQKTALKFNLSPTDREVFDTIIQQSGSTPLSSKRKFPRIPHSAYLSTFPLNMMVSSFETSLPGSPMSFEVEDLSPEGALISTENQNAATLAPGDHLSFTLEPRGWFTIPVNGECVIRRILEKVNPANGNINRSFGVHFNVLTAANKEAYYSLLKQILEQIKSENK